MFRQLMARLRLLLLVGPHRKLFLLVFLWTCVCLFLFRAALFGGHSTAGGPGEESRAARAQLRARSVAASTRRLESGFSSSAATLELAPDATNANQLIYSIAAPAVAPPTRPGQGAPSLQPPKVTSAKPTQANKATSQQVESTSEDKSRDRVAGSECHYEYPSLFDLHFNNVHWQHYQQSAPSNTSASSTANYFLYNAYYDDRWRAPAPSVRVLAMIDRIEPPPTNCLLWSSKLTSGSPQQQQQSANKRLVPLVTRATFVYAWYPKWGNYKDGILQPWIVTCPLPASYGDLVPDSVSLAPVPPEHELPQFDDLSYQEPTPPGAKRRRRGTDEEQQQLDSSQSQPSSSSSSSSSAPISQPFVSSLPTEQQQTPAASRSHQQTRRQVDCSQVDKLPIVNNLPVYNKRPRRGQQKDKFAVCVKGLDFPEDPDNHISIRLVEWIELLNLLGAKKIFLYSLNVDENIRKVLKYYERRGMIELSPLTLPGDQPNQNEYQHLYLKNRLTAKRQNELIPYNDCLYRNLHVYKYLVLLDIDEIIMPMKHANWFELMDEIEAAVGRLGEQQNYSRASYNVRNVYFFDDLAGPLGTTTLSSVGGGGGGGGSASEPKTTPNQEDAPPPPPGNRKQHSLESGIPHYLHMMSHVYRSKNYTEPGQYVKCFHNIERVVSLHNHFPMNCFGQCTTYSVATDLAHLQHYRKDCVGPLKQSCDSDFRLYTTRDTTIWKYRQQIIKRTTRVVNKLSLLSSSSSSNIGSQTSATIAATTPEAEQ